MDDIFQELLRALSNIQDAVQHIFSRFAQVNALVSWHAYHLVKIFSKISPSTLNCVPFVLCG